MTHFISIAAFSQLHHLHISCIYTLSMSLRFSQCPIAIPYRPRPTPPQYKTLQNICTLSLDKNTFEHKRILLLCVKLFAYILDMWLFYTQMTPIIIYFGQIFTSGGTHTHTAKHIANFILRTFWPSLLYFYSKLSGLCNKDTLHRSVPHPTANIYARTHVPLMYKQTPNNNTQPPSPFFLPTRPAIQPSTFIAHIIRPTKTLCSALYKQTCTHTNTLWSFHPIWCHGVQQHWVLTLRKTDAKKTLLFYLRFNGNLHVKKFSGKLSDFLI